MRASGAARALPTAGRRRLVAGGVGAAVLLLMATAACSGDDNTGSIAASCDSPGITADQVKVGMIYPDTGPVAPIFLAARGGFEARVALANDSDGVHGRKIDLVWADDTGTPTVNDTVARRFVERDGVFALGELTIGASGSARYLADTGVPVVGLAGEREWNDYDNMFAPTYVYSSGTPVSTFGVFARAQGGTRLAVVEDPLSAPSQSLSDQMIAGMSSEGIVPVARIPYTVGQSSPARAVESIEDSGADVLVVQTQVDGLLEILSASRQAGVSYKVVLSAVAYDKDLLARVGPALAGATAYFSHISWESSSPDLARFREAMARYAPETANPDQVTVLAAYIAADMLVRGLELAGECPTREAFRTRLRALTDYDAAGLMPGGLDLSTNRGNVPLCYTFAKVNPEGTAYQTVPAPGGNEQWCGTRLQT